MKKNRNLKDWKQKKKKIQSFYQKKQYKEEVK